MISKTTAYGIRALAYLANHPNRPCGLQEIVEHEKIPPVYLRKVLGELRRHRLLRSRKGIHGGYELARPPELITLWEVFRVLDPDPYLDMCILGYERSTHEPICALHEEWQKVRQNVIKLLKSKTISEVAAFVSSHQPADQSSARSGTRGRDQEQKRGSL